MIEKIKKNIDDIKQLWANNPLFVRESKLFSKLTTFNWPSFALCLLVLVFFYIQITSFLQIQVIKNGEARAISNIPIEFALHNKMHYPLHSEDFINPDIESLQVHPPLFYYLEGMLFKVIGIGRWQLQVSNLIVGLLLIISAAIFAKRFYGFSTAIVIIFLSLTFKGLYFSEYHGRPDMPLGLIHGLFLIILFTACWHPAYKKYRFQLSFLLGVLAVAALATHWNGIFIFAYLPIYLLLMIWYREPWQKHAMLVVAGIVAAFIPWILLYKSDFFGVFQSIFLIGGKRIIDPSLRSGHMNIMHFFVPITKWDDGWILGSGFLLGVFYYIISAIGHIKSRMTPYQIINGNQVRSLDLLLFSSVIGYLMFYFMFVTNYHFQYMSNIYFPLFILAARGYTLLWEFFKKYITENKIIHGILLLPILIYLINNVNLVSPFALEHPNKSYNATRQALTQFLDHDHQIFMGVDVYMYLYDYKYKTNRAVEIESLQRQVYKDDFPSMLERAELAKKSGDIMIISESNYMYQFRFFDERVWSLDFVKVGLVMVDYRTKFTILYRKEIAEELFNSLNLKPNALGCVDGVRWVSFDPIEDTSSSITNLNWGKLSFSEKKKAVQGYLAKNDNFGRTGLYTEKELAGFVKRIDPYISKVNRVVHKNRKSWLYGLDIVRSMEQAIDNAVMPKLVRCRKSA